jgi:AcrR family transcriptional regulator
MTSFEVLGQAYTLPFSNTSASSRTKELILMEATVLFALKGYSAVSMKDIAEKVGITAAALYNHFTSKEGLWDSALAHSLSLYYLYHDRLDEKLREAGTMREMLDILFDEPSRMRNMFTCYCFAMIMKEQFSDAKAGEIFRDTFVEYGTAFTEKWLNQAVNRGMAGTFDTRTVAKIFVQCVLTNINLKLHEMTGQDVKFGITDTFDGLKRLVLQIVDLPDE